MAGHELKRNKTDERIKSYIGRKKDAFIVYFAFGLSMMHLEGELSKSRRTENWELFTSTVLVVVYRVSAFFVKNWISFLQTGSYDFHQMSQLNHLRTSCLAREKIADHYGCCRPPRAKDAKGDKNGRLQLA